MTTQEIKLTRKCSTSDLFFEEPVLIKDIVDSRTGNHRALEVVDADGQSFTLNVPDWFRDQYLIGDDAKCQPGDYISGGWDVGKFRADVWAVVQ